MRLVVVEFMTLDGVMEAPGTEPHRSGRNAWAMKANDDKLDAYNRDQIFEADALLFGRTTYNIWAAFWPTGPESAGMAERINAMPKYVVSRTLGRVDWDNTTILRGSPADDVAAIKDAGDGNLVLYGSAELVDELLDVDLVDELRIMVFPVVLGSGKRLFRDEAVRRPLRLTGSRAFPSGVVLLTYERGVEPAEPEDFADYVWTPEQVESFRAREETDRVLATVLFTDIVDSTSKAAAAGDREWRQMLNRHDQTARAEVERWHGTFVKSTGDGILARFNSPSRALRCALGLCQAARRIGLEIRVAVHTGEIEVRGADIGGIGVHIASRVLAAAANGEVVVTRTVRDLAAGTDVAFEDRGRVSLRGVPGEWELFAASMR